MMNVEMKKVGDDVRVLISGVPEEADYLCIDLQRGSSGGVWDSVERHERVAIAPQTGTTFVARACLSGVYRAAVRALPSVYSQPISVT